MTVKGPMDGRRLGTSPHPLPRAHLNFEPEFSDARESFKCVQSLDFNTVVRVIQHGAHQRDVISSTGRGLGDAGARKRQKCLP